MKIKIEFALIAVVTSFMVSCGQKSHEFVGRFTDEFDNMFELRDDHTATIHFAGSDNVVETRWRDSVSHKNSFATIEYNGDPAYYYLQDGKLYRRFEDMQDGNYAIIIKYED